MSNISDLWVRLTSMGTNIDPAETPICEKSVGPIFAKICGDRLIVSQVCEIVLYTDTHLY